MDCKLLLFDLDGTLLRSDKTISDETLRVLQRCVEIFEPAAAEDLKETLDDCDCVRFSDGYWYKFTKKDVTKEKAILEICRQCGIGIAMGNAIEEVKAVADLVIGSNDEDGIAKYLTKKLKKINGN